MQRSHIRQNATVTYSNNSNHHYYVGELKKKVEQWDVIDLFITVKHMEGNFI